MLVHWHGNYWNMLLVTLAVLFLLCHVKMSHWEKGLSHFLNKLFNVTSSDMRSSFAYLFDPRCPSAGDNIYSYLNSHLSLMANSQSAVDLLGSGLHVWPDFHGNRSPLADPTLKGMVREHESRLHLTSPYIKYYWLKHRFVSWFTNNLQRWRGHYRPSCNF